MKSGDKTKRILLDTACELFAEKGFHKTTMRDITDTAKTNIAAVNYHFGDKKKLYFESFKHAANIERKLIYEELKTIDGPKLMLEKFLYLRLEGVTSATPCGWLIKMFHQEITNPTILHEKIIKEVMFKQREKLENIIKSFFEMNLNDGQLDVVFGCFITPMIHQMKHKQQLAKCNKIFPMRNKLNDVNRTKMLVCFTMSGLEGLKKEFKNEK